MMNYKKELAKVEGKIAAQEIKLNELKRQKKALEKVKIAMEKLESELTGGGETGTEKGGGKEGSIVADARLGRV